MEPSKSTFLTQISNFFHDSGTIKQYYMVAFSCASSVLSYLLSALVTLVAIHAIYLTYRFVRIKLDARVEATGDKAIIITGATSGIGLAVAKHAYKLGFTVFACYYNDKEPGYAELMELSHNYVGSDVRLLESKANLFLVHMDIRSTESVARAGAEIELNLKKHSMRLHCLLNNAGLGCASLFGWIGQQTIDDVLNTNLRGLLLVTRQFFPIIIQDKSRVLNVSSGLSTMPRKAHGLYGLTKSAIDYFSESLDDELRPHGAMCCYLRPGDLMATSNIIFAQYKSLKQLTDNLSEKEKCLYKESLDDFYLLTYKIMKEKLENCSEEASQLSEIYGIDIPDLPTLKKLIAQQEKDLSYSKRFGMFLMQTFGGVDCKKTLEDIGVITAFDYAICAEKPLSTLYPGPPLYFYFSGPHFNLHPEILKNKFSRSLLRKHGV